MNYLIVFAPIGFLCVVVVVVNVVVGWCLLGMTDSIHDAQLLPFLRSYSAPGTGYDANIQSFTDSASLDSALRTFVSGNYRVLLLYVRYNVVVELATKMYALGLFGPNFIVIIGEGLYRAQLCSSGA